MQILESAGYKDQKSLGRLPRFPSEPGVSNTVSVGKDVYGHEEGCACLPVGVLGSRVLRRLGGETRSYPSQFFRPFALPGLWAEAVFEVSGHLPGCALVPRRIHDIRSKWSQKWWFVPWLNQRRGLLEEVTLKEQSVSEVHMCPRERGQAYKEVVPLRSGFSRGKAEL